MSGAGEESGAAGMRLLYRAAGAAAGAAALLGGLFAGAGLAEKRRQRRGLWPPRREAGPWVWIQAASVGEVDLGLALARELRRRRPGLAFVVSTMTDGGRLRAGQDSCVESRYFPIDSRRFVKRIVEGGAPCLFVSVETEIWPETWRLLQGLGVPVAVANGRLSERSVPRYRLLRPFLGPALAGLAKVCARDEEAARRWVEIGAREEAVEVAGNIKFDLAVGGDESRKERLFAPDGCPPLLLAASTHEGEEGPALEALAKVLAARPDAGLLLAPRHPDRSASVLRLVADRGLAVRAWSDLDPGAGRPRWPDGVRVVVLDRLGLLRPAYASAVSALVGGSLVPGPGGHNLLEAVAEGCPVVTGAFLGNVEDQAALLREAGALAQVPDAEGLARFWLQSLADPEVSRRPLVQARVLAAARRGALARTAAALEGLLGASVGGAGA